MGRVRGTVMGMTPSGQLWLWQISSITSMCHFSIFMYLANTHPIDRRWDEWNGTSLGTYLTRAGVYEGLSSLNFTERSYLRQGTMVVFACGKQLRAMFGGQQGVSPWNRQRRPVNLKAKTWKWTLDLFMYECIYCLRHSLTCFAQNNVPVNSK